jgi:hypothetical protein
MQTTHFHIIGNIWIFIAISLILIIFSIYSYYHTIPPINRNYKTLLIFLRSSALIVLLFILFEPSFVKTVANVIKPKLAVLIDNSISNGLKDRSVNRKEVVRNLLNTINFDELKDNTNFFTFSNKVEKISNSSLNKIEFNGQITDLSNAFDNIRNIYKDDNLQAILLISDGAINSGANPLNNTENFTRPVFTIGIGDTIEPKDIAVKSIITNEVGFINTPLEIFANFTSSGFSNSTKIKLYENDVIIDSKDIALSNDKHDYSISFNYVPQKEGIQKLTVKIDPLENEYSKENNSISTFIKIIKNKKAIAIFSSAPSPDVSFIKQYLSQDKEARTNLFIQKEGADFYIKPTPNDFTETQLIVLINFPNKQTPDAILNNISQELSKGKPLLFISGPDIDYKKLNKLSTYLPFEVASNTSKEFKAFLNPLISSDNPIFKIDGIPDSKAYWENLPPIIKTESFVNPKVGATVLSTMKINNVQLNEPLMLIREVQGSRTAAFLGYGIYAWKLSGYAAEIAKGNTKQIDLFNVFINNTIRWLSISNVEKQLIVKTNKKQYSSTDEIEFIANVNDNSMNPIDDAQIQLLIKGKGFSKEYQIPSLGSGNYFLNIPALPKGDYSFIAQAYVNNNLIGKEENKFSVGEINFEYLNLKMNKSLLSTLSSNSNGKFYIPQNATSIIDNIKSLPNFKETVKINKTEVQFWNKLYLLIISILLFSIEWAIRKRLSML